MADNFRNKQWFKNMSQERKDEICKQFDINEKTLRKAGRETDDGRIVIDLLRIDHMCHYPKDWDEAYEALKDHIEKYNNVINETKTDDELVLVFEEIYNLLNAHTYLKYKDSIHNKVLLHQAKKCVQNDINEYINNDEENKPYYAYKIKMHLKVLIESDLKLIKENN